MSHDAYVIGQPVRVSSLQYDVDPGNLTWVIKLDGKYLYLLSRLGGSIINLYLEVLLFFMIIEFLTSGPRNLDLPLRW